MQVTGSQQRRHVPGDPAGITAERQSSLRLQLLEQGAACQRSVADPDGRLRAALSVAVFLQRGHIGGDPGFGDSHEFSRAAPDGVELGHRVGPV